VASVVAAPIVLWGVLCLFGILENIDAVLLIVVLFFAFKGFNAWNEEMARRDYEKRHPPP